MNKIFIIIVTVITFLFASCDDVLEDVVDIEDLNLVNVVTRGVFSEKPYVEVCGVKWAKGNLQYQKGTTDAGFVDGWSIADKQYGYFNLCYGRGENSICQNMDSVDHFNWGVCGKNALTVIKLFSRATSSTICGKMYLDQYCTKETDEFDKALFGDISYWASKGQYRMPSEEEIKTLLEEASYTPSLLDLINGESVYGYYFFTPNGQREVSKTIKKISLDDLDFGLFLPGAGFRDLNTDTIIRAGACGFYWHGTPNTENVSGGLYTMRFVFENVFWSHDNRNYGRSIRPVYIGKKEEIKPYVEVCGIKWAKGNLQYSTMYEENGFRKGWRIAPMQFLTQSFKKGKGYLQNEDSLDLFNWGVCGENALTCSKIYLKNAVENISGLMFEDNEVV